LQPEPASHWSSLMAEHNSLAIVREGVMLYAKPDELYSLASFVITRKENVRYLRHRNHR
jgi:hypothetical protein